MDKIQRKIFSPDTLTDCLINGLMIEKNLTVSEIVNGAILNTYTPCNENLHRETDLLFQKIIRNINISKDEIKSIMARCVATLKDYPIETPDVLESIMRYFINPVNNIKRYDYVLIADDNQDQKLRQLKTILGTIDNDFFIGNHEFGENAREVFKHWDLLREYPEIYTALATIIDCEDFYFEMSVFEAIYLIAELDKEVQKSTLHAKKDRFPVKLTLEQLYGGYYYEIMIYYTDNGYAALSKDNGFENMPESILSYYEETHGLSLNSLVTEEDIKTIMDYENKGRTLFRRLAK